MAKQTDSGRDQPHGAAETALLLFGVCVIGSNAFLMSPILENISRSVDAPVAQIAWAVSAYGGSTAFAGLFLTGLAQRFGYRRSLFLSGTILTIGILATGLATSWMALIAAQAMAGIAAGIMLPTLYSMAVIIAPKGKESRTLGKVTAGWSLALVAGVPMSAFISDILSWRHAYYLAFLLSSFSTLGFSLLPSTGSSSQTTSALAALDIPNAKPVLLISFLYMVSFYGVYTFMGSHIQRELGFSPAYAGFAVLAYGLGFGLAGIMLGKFLDKFSPWRLFGPILLCISAVYLGFLLMSQIYWTLLIACIFWGGVNQVGLNCLVSILTQLDDHQRVRLMGIYSAVAYGGTMVAGVTYGAIYQNEGFPATLATSATLCIVSFIIGVRIQKIRSAARAKAG